MRTAIPTVKITKSKIERLLRDGKPQESIPIAVLAPELVQYLRAKVRIVRLYHEVAVAKTLKHRLLPEHWLLVPLALDLGWAGMDRKRHILFLYEDNVIFNKTFKVVVKSTFGGRELILTSVYKQEPPDIRSCKRRCAKIRDHKFIEPETGSGS